MEYIYAALLLHKSGREINEENLKNVVSAAGISVDESKIKAVVSSLKNVDIDKELEKPLSFSSQAPKEELKEQTKKEEPKQEKKEAAAEGLAALFG
jgi:large subunit ribosomal protein L12